MVYSSYLLKTLCLSAILSISTFTKTSYAFSIAPSAPNSLFVGGSLALKFTNMDADWMDMDTKLAVLNSNNVLEVIAVLATKSHVANNYADIISLPNTIPEGSNYYFISQETGGSNYAESGPYNIPKSFSPNGGNLPSVTAATVLETYSLDTPAPLAVAQTSAPSSSTTGSVTPTPTVSDASSSDTKSSSASATPKSSENSSQSKSSENSSQSKSSTESEENPGQKIHLLSKTVIIVIAVIVPVVAIAIISTAICCLVKRRRRTRTSSGTTPWGTRTTNFVTRDRTSGTSTHY